MDLTAPFTVDDLPEALREIGQAQVTGELVVEGSRGRKSIIISQGQMSVTSEGGVKLRLGDILIFREKISKEELVDALALQSERGGGRLGDALCEMGYVTRGEIDEVVHFQLEEELCDIFNWEDATFQFFRGPAAAAEGSATTSLSIDPNQIIVEAARRVNTWNQIKRRIPSMYGIYRLTSRGERMLSSATRGGRKLLDLVARNETVEAIAQKSFLGRFAVCRSLMELLEAGSIEPVPDEELPELAEELEEAGKFEQARGVYGSLYETEPDPAMREAIAAHMAELEAVAVEAGPEIETEEEFPVERKPVVSWVTAGLFVAFMFLALVAIGSIPRVKAFWFGENPAPFREAEARALALEEDGELGAAADAYLSFAGSHPRSIYADEASERAKELLDHCDARAGPLVALAERLSAEDRISGAIEAYRRVLREHPRTTRSLELLRKIEELSRARSERLRSLTAEETEEILAEGKRAFEKGRFTRARALLSDVKAARNASPRDTLAADKLLSAVVEKEKELAGLIAGAEVASSRGEHEKAAEDLKRVVRAWPDSLAGLLASSLLETLERDNLRARSVLAQAKALLAERDRLFAEGRADEAKIKEAEAVPILIRAGRYSRVAAAAKAREILEGLISADSKLSSLIEDAKKAKAEGRKDDAFRIIYDLANAPESGAVLSQLVLEYEIRSIPGQANVAVDGRDRGVTSPMQPFQLGLNPLEKAQVKLTAVGFEEREFIVDPSRDRERVIVVRLDRRIPARRGMDAPARLARWSAPNAVFVVSGKKLSAIPAGSTSASWSYDLPGEPGEPIVADDRVSVLVGEKVFSFRASQRLAETATVPGRCAAPPIVAELRKLAGLVIAYASPAGTEVVYAIELVKKKQKWTSALPGELAAPPLWGDDRLYLASARALTCLDGASGNKLWSAPLSSGPVDGPVFCGDGVAVCLAGGEVVVYRKSDGARLVSAKLGASSVVGGEGVVFAAGGGKLSRVEFSQEEAAWTAALEPAEPVYGTYAAGKLYFGGGDGRVQCIDGQTGEVEWQTRVKGAVAPYPVVIRGNLYFARQEGELCLVKLMERR